MNPFFVVVVVQELTADQIKARRFYAHFDESSEDSYDNRAADSMTISLPAEGHGKRVVLASVLAPYSYTYMSVVRSLESLRDYGLLEGEFIKICVQEITSQVNSGNCKYSKCWSISSIVQLFSMHLTRPSDRICIDCIDWNELFLVEL